VDKLQLIIAGALIIVAVIVIAVVVLWRRGRGGD
jgi:hypothetical protein